jgi:hypothetical protein
VKINPATAKRILLEEAENEALGNIDPVWQERIEGFSQICEGTSKTHIAFLGTALLAKCVNIECDAFSVKAGDRSPGAYSARGLSHGVLVPLAPKLDINLGVTGREPLNNQPYFRIMRVTRDIPVLANAKIATDALVDLLEIINGLASSDEARDGLRAFIHVRRKYSPRYANFGEDTDAVSAHELCEVITRFVAENSEGGRRAQAVVAGLLDLFAGPDRVLSGRINDPDRHLPGDVGIKNRENPETWEKVFEVRDKVVSNEDVYLFIQKSIENDVKEAAIVCAHAAQADLDTKEISIWARERGVSITFFLGWDSFITQIAFWSEAPQAEGLKNAPNLIYNRLVEIEASEDAINTWVKIFQAAPQ